MCLVGCFCGIQRLIIIIVNIIFIVHCTYNLSNKNHVVRALLSQLLLLFIVAVIMVACVAILTDSCGLPLQLANIAMQIAAKNVHTMKINTKQLLN